MTERQELQRHLDEIAYNLYVDTHCDIRETAFQSGLSVATVRARVRRHSRRLQIAESNEAGEDYSSTARGL